MRTPLLLLALPFMLLITAGCTSHPQHGSGGMAEHYLSESFSPVLPDEPLGPEHGLRFDWQLGKLHLDMLIQEGAKWCFPASVLQLTVRQQRIARELDGGLQLDAANDIVIQRKALNKLEKQLDAVTSQAECIAPGQEDGGSHRYVDVIETLINLLNSDNQFAYNSAEVNPKYMGHLAEAAQILKQNPTLTLSVTGHADADASHTYNEKLALDRANQVKRYLIIFGLNPERIVTHSLGERIPLFDGNTPGIKLTNRRVSIEVNTDASEKTQDTASIQTQTGGHL